VGFHVLDLRVAILEYIWVCITCQRNKSEHLYPMGLLQPPEVPITFWTNVAMNFIKGFLRVDNKYVILTIVDRFSKATIFFAVGPSLTVACVFFKSIVKLQVIPSSIVNDRDQVFIGNF
jgi:hypothetical protein